MFDIENIKDPSFLKDLTIDELEILAKEISIWFLGALSVSHWIELCKMPENTMI